MRDLRVFLFLLLTLVASSSMAQFVVGKPGAAAAAASAPPPNWMGAAGKVYVDTTTLYGRRVGTPLSLVKISCDHNVRSDCGQDAPASSVVDPAGSGGGGAFRVDCLQSHMGFDDPIVYPGDPGKSHLHVFFGNTSTSAASDLTDMSLTGRSTCAGGTANATGYWVPAVIYSCPKDSTDPCDKARDGEVQQFSDMNAYYKCPSSGIIRPAGDPEGGYRCSTGGYGGTPARWFPIGFRMITGDPNSNHPINNNTGGIVCYRNGTGYASFDHIPTTAEGIAQGGCDELNIFPQFYECWDGVNIDSPDHKSHVAHADYYAGCPATHPVLLPWIGLNVHLMNVVTADLDYLRFSSDPPKSSGQPAGWTLHSDWANGWSHDPNFNGFGKGTVTDIIMRNCYHLTGTPMLVNDCHNQLLGDVLGNNVFWTLYKDL